MGMMKIAHIDILEGSNDAMQVQCIYRMYRCIDCCIFLHVKFEALSVCCPAKIATTSSLLFSRQLMWLVPSCCKTTFCACIETSPPDASNKTWRIWKAGGIAWVLWGTLRAGGVLLECSKMSLVLWYWLVDFPNTQTIQSLFVDSSGCVVGSGRDRYTTSDASWG